MYESFQFRSADAQQVCLQDESLFLISYLETQSAETATVAYLQQVARVRMDLDMAASLIVETVKPSGVFFCCYLRLSLSRSWAGVGQKAHLQTFPFYSQQKRKTRVRREPRHFWTVLRPCVGRVGTSGTAST